MPDPQPDPPAPEPHARSEPDPGGLGARVAGIIARHPALIVIIALLIGVLAFQGARRLGIN